MRRPCARLSTLVLALSACNTGFDPQYLVKDVRILALGAHVEGNDTAADAAPGDTLVLEALVGNPLGRTVTIGWYGCAPTPDQSLPPCADPEFLRDPARLASDPRVLPLGTGESVAVPLPDVTAALEFVEGLAEAQPSYQCSLYAELPVVAVVEGDGRRQVALKRVRLVPPQATLPPELAGGYLPNENPAVSRIVWDRADGCRPESSEVTPGGFPSGSLFLCAEASPLSSGTYSRCGPAGERESTFEALSWQWYVTGGEFPEFDGVGDATGRSVEFVRPAGPFTLWAILRDGRGGVAWTRHELAAAP